MSTSRAWLPKIALPVVVFCLSAPLADGAFRLAGDRPSRDLKGQFVAWGEGGYRLGVNVHTSAEFYTGRMDVYTDNLGLRCGLDPTTKTAAGDTIDVLYLGDSQGFGNLLPYEETIVGQLAMRGTRNGLHMANASVGGHSLGNQLEIARWLHNEQRTTIRRIVILLTPRMITAAGRYIRATVGADGRLYESRPSHLSKVAMWAKTNTVIYNRLRGAFRRLIGLQGAFGRLFGVEAIDPVAVGLYENQHELSERTDALVRILAETRDWARSVGATLNVVYIPLAVEMDFRPVQDLAREVGASVDVNTPFQLSKLAAAHLGIGLLDLRPALAKIGTGGRPITVEADPHYNAATSAASADLIWSFLYPQ